jgi:WD40 repeat protein
MFIPIFMFGNVITFAEENWFSVDDLNLLTVENIHQIQEIGVLELSESDTAYSIELSKDEKLIAISTSNTIYVWDMETGESITTLSEPDTYYGRIAFLEDRNLLIDKFVNRQTHILSIWNIDTQITKANFYPADNSVYGIVVDPLSEWFFVYNDVMTLRLSIFGE